MEIYHSTTVSAEEWDNLGSASDDTWLFHLQIWIEMTAHLYSVENHYFIARENGRNVGGFISQLTRGSRYGRPCNQASSVTMGSAGPFCIRGLPPTARQRVFSKLTSSAIEWARRMSVEKISCSLPPLAHSNLNNARGVNPLVLAGWRDVSTHTRITSLSRSESDLWTDLAYDARRSVKLARSAGYTVERTCWREMLDEYYRVHVETYHRTGVSPHPRAYFEGIATQIAEGDHAVLWVGRDPSGRPVAFHNCARFRNSSVYWTGCCETDHLRSGVNYLLFWHALIGAKGDGCEWYEIGEAFPDEQNGKVKGLTIFKRKFGGELYRYYKAEIRLFDPPLPTFHWGVGDFVRQRLRDWRDRYIRL